MFPQEQFSTNSLWEVLCKHPTAPLLRGTGLRVGCSPRLPVIPSRPEPRYPGSMAPNHHLGFTGILIFSAPTSLSSARRDTVGMVA